jgi:probable DNA metabolism protein
MPGGRFVATPSDAIYYYDGSLEGFYCCVFDSVYRRELPADIVFAGEAQPNLFFAHEVETLPEHADRVRASLPVRLSPAALELTETVFCSCMEHKELRTLRFLLRGFQEGRCPPLALADPDAAPLLQAQRRLLGEAHLLKGFVRFSDVGSSLVAAITPKNFVLPFLIPHFSARFSRENFLIFDKTHRAALIRKNGQSRLISAEHIDFPSPSPEEMRYRALWRCFYDTVAIESRENPRCRMTHMPKRYWENMTEMNREDAPAQLAVLQKQ